MFNNLPGRNGLSRVVQQVDRHKKHGRRLVRYPMPAVNTLCVIVPKNTILPWFSVTNLPFETFPFAQFKVNIACILLPRPLYI